MKRIRAIISVLLITSVLAALCGVNVSAASKLTDGVSILNPRQNVHGVGFEWDNPHDMLTLNNLWIETKDDYGFKLPDGATVILKGVNRISASVAALYVGGSVIIKGSGSLILDGGEFGIFCNSSDITDKLSIVAGKYEVKGGKDAIRSNIQKISLSGATMTLKGGENGISAKSLVVSNGVTIKSEGGFVASQSLSVEASNIEIQSNSAALRCDSDLRITKMNMKAGDSLDSLGTVSEYGGQKAFKSETAWKYVHSSVLFGENVSFATDVAVAVAAAVIVATAIVLPIYFKKKKLKKIMEARENN